MLNQRLISGSLFGGGFLLAVFFLPAAFAGPVMMVLAGVTLWEFYGMLAGAGLTLGYMLLASPAWRAWWGLPPGGLWWGIHPVSAGFFGVPAGFAAIALVSWFDRGARVRGERGDDGVAGGSL